MKSPIDVVSLHGIGKPLHIDTNWFISIRFEKESFETGVFLSLDVLRFPEPSTHP